MVSHSARKSVLVHLGPHKTGTTAIQKSLSDASDTLREAGIYYLHSSKTHAAALDLANERFDDAEVRLALISTEISGVDEDHIILSQEDFCGALIGRSMQRKVYPKLTKNLRILMRMLRPHHVRFVFFVRNETDWLRSCYHQHLKFRTRFHSFDSFASHFGQDLSWSEKLEKPKEVFGNDLVVLEYQSDPASGIERLVNLVERPGVDALTIPTVSAANKSPTADQIMQLERINEMSEFAASSWFSKSLIMNEKLPNLSGGTMSGFADWPPPLRDPGYCALPKLEERVQDRVRAQEADDFLPKTDVNLNELLHERLPDEVEAPNLSRADIRDQSVILEYHLRGKSRLNYLNALTISYLRRDTVHTGKARILFHRIWREQGAALVNELSTRWLISTLQTFLDHGENEAQRSIGTAGYFYANMMKIYEGERAIEGLEQDSGYSNTKPQTKNRFRGLDRYSVGGSDLMLNTNALALEIAQRDPVAGLVLQEFLLRVKTSQNVFSRHDRTRRKKGINVPGFTDVWTFFDPD